MTNHKLVPIINGAPLEASGQFLRPNINKLAIKEKNQILFIDYNEIVCCEAQKNYTFVYLLSGDQIRISKCLKDVQEQIKSTYFFRIHASYLVNLRYIKRIAKSREWIVTVADRDLPVSRSRIIQLKTFFGL